MKGYAENIGYNETTPDVPENETKTLVFCSECRDNFDTAFYSQREFERSKEKLKEAKENARELLKKAKKETNTKETEELSQEMQKVMFGI